MYRRRRSTFIISVSAWIVKRQFCSDIITKTCQHGGDQFCCVAREQPNLFATCDHDGFHFYTASCGSTSTCIQDGDASISCS